MSIPNNEIQHSIHWIHWVNFISGVFTKYLTSRLWDGSARGSADSRRPRFKDGTSRAEGLLLCLSSLGASPASPISLASDLKEDFSGTSFFVGLPSACNCYWLWAGACSKLSNSWSLQLYPRLSSIALNILGWPRFGFRAAGWESQPPFFGPSKRPRCYWKKIETCRLNYRI